AEAAAPVPDDRRGYLHLLAQEFWQPPRAAVHGPSRAPVWNSGGDGDRVLRRLFRPRDRELSDLHFHWLVWLRFFDRVGQRQGDQFLHEPFGRELLRRHGPHLLPVRHAGGRVQHARTVGRQRAGHSHRL